MKVKEFIDILSGYDPDSEVVVRTENFYGDTQFYVADHMETEAVYFEGHWEPPEDHDTSTETVKVVVID